MFAQLGNKECAKQMVDSIRPDAGSQIPLMAGIAEVLALSGETERAKRIVTDFKLLESVPPISRFRQAALSLAFGDREHSLSFLAKALEDREAELLWIGVAVSTSARKPACRAAKVLKKNDPQELFSRCCLPR